MGYWSFVDKHIEQIEGVKSPQLDRDFSVTYVR